MLSETFIARLLALTLTLTQIIWLLLSPVVRSQQCKNQFHAMNKRQRGTEQENRKSLTTCNANILLFYRGTEREWIFRENQHNRIKHQWNRVKNWFALFESNSKTTSVIVGTGEQFNMSITFEIINLRKIDKTFKKSVVHKLFKIDVESLDLTLIWR